MALTAGIEARLAAAKVLHALLKSKRTLDDVLATEPDYKRLTGPDRGFSRAMVSAALRHLGRLDAVLMLLVTRGRKRLAGEVAALLRIGAAQLWLLETPEHAAVGETVAATKAWPETAAAAGLVNAVLRKAISARADFDAQPAEATWPDWLRADLERSIGGDGVAALARAQLEPPELHLTLHPDMVATQIAALAEALGARELVPGTLALETGAVDGLPGYDAGAWWVQDVGAALAARLLAAGPDEHVLDLCAAPGGKTLQLAATGADIIAVDRSKARLKRLKQNLERIGLGPRVDVITADVEAWTPPKPANAILLDAPCSALGTLRRHPEGAWIKSKGDVDRFPEVQARLLAAASDWLAPGGRLIYCVCTPRRQEGADIVEAACAGGGWVRDPVTPEESEALGFASSLTDAGDLLTLPHEDTGFGHDAFYIARLTRGD